MDILRTSGSVGGAIPKAGPQVERSARPDLNGAPVSADPSAELADYYRGLYEKHNEVIAAQLLLVNPEMAKRWLDNSNLSDVKNRALGLATVERYARYMVTRQWSVNGETIILDSEECVLDGQHRLTALIKADVTIPMLVIMGIDRDAFKTLNQGKIRSGSDTLATLGIENSKVVSAALKWVFRYDTDSMAFLSMKLSNLDVVKLYEENRGISADATFVLSHCVYGVHQPGPFTFLSYMANKFNPGNKDVTAFFQRLFTGANLEPGTPAHLLHNRLNTIAIKRQEQRTLVLNQLAIMALTIKALNATLSGKQLRVLKWTQDEEFPRFAREV